VSIMTFPPEEIKEKKRNRAKGLLSLTNCRSGAKRKERGKFLLESPSHLNKRKKRYKQQINTKRQARICKTSEGQTKERKDFRASASPPGVGGGPVGF